MLSFNELAWIAAGGVMVMFLLFWNQYQKYVDEHPLNISEAEVAALRQRPVLRDDQEIVLRSRSANMLVISRSEYSAITNRRFLRPNEVAVETNWLNEMNQLNKDWVRLSPTEYSQLKARIVVQDDEEVVPKSSILESKLRQKEIEKLRLAVDTLSNSAVSLMATNRLLSSGFETSAQVRRELLNLKGKLRNVAIVIDRSASMGERVKSGDKEISRWNNTVDVAASWLKHLAIEKCVLIVFDDVVETIPRDGRLLKMEDSTREELVNSVRGLKPRGNTATLLALRAVYERFSSSSNAIDTIILFTDGKPYVPAGGNGSSKDGFGGDSSSISRRLMSETLALARLHPDIPINVVAVGDYFDREQSQFLLELKDATGGAFLGR